MDGFEMVIAFWIIFFIVIVAILSIFCIKSSQKQKKHKAEENMKADEQISFFINAGCVISKQIHNLLIDDVHKKWMITGSDVIFNYADVIDVSIVEDGKQVEMSAFSVQNTIKTMSVLVTTNNAINALVDIPIVQMKGNLGLEISSYEYSNCKKIALEQEAFFKAIIATNSNTTI